MDDFEKVLREKSLETFPGIGKVISAIIYAVVKYGYHPYHQELLHKTPPSLFELIKVPGLGLNKLKILYESYNVTNLADLEKLLSDEERKIKGFGPAFKKKILRQIEAIKLSGNSLLYPNATALAHSLIDILKDKTQKIEITGALRRKLEVVYEIDLLAISDNISDCMNTLNNHYIVQKVLQKENSKVSVLLKNSIRANLTLVSKEEFPYALFTSTGNNDHVAKIKTIAQANDTNIRVASNEKTLYKKLHMPFIVPELRENYGEIEAALQGTLPNLIEYTDLKGSFHCHTTYSDGNTSIEEMAASAKKLGWEYIGIADHSKSSYQANGMSEEQLFDQINHIKSLNTSKDFHIFSGIECDILKDGELDFPNEILKQLDYVIVSIHRFFSMEEELMTKRLLKAIENPYTTMIGHLTGRLLRSRNPYQVNIPKIIDACIANNKIIELNASPSRLDMDWREWVKAKDRGLKCSINPDAHTAHELNNCQNGILMARKGWLEKKDVINILSLSEMKTYLFSKKSSI